MHAFTFKFEALLQQKRHDETRCKRQLAQHLAARVNAHDRLRRAQSTITESKHALGDALTGTVDLDAVAGFARYTASVTAQGHADVAALASLEQTIIEARTALNEARRHVKALESLKEKHHDAWLQDQRRTETARLDEAATQAWLREQQREIAA